MFHSLLALSVFLFTPNIFAEESRYLGIDESMELALPNQPLIRVQKKGILKIKDLGPRLRLTGAKLGETKISINKQSWTIYVLKKDIYQTWQSLNIWSQQKRGPEVRVKNHQVFLEGKLLTLRDFETLEESLGTHPHFTNRCRLSSPLRQKIQNFLEDLLQKHGLPKGEWSFAPNWQLAISH